MIFEKLITYAEGQPANGSEFFIDPDLVVRESTGPAKAQADL
jgi:hypothetical protein